MHGFMSPVTYPQGMRPTVTLDALANSVSSAFIENVSSVSVLRQ
jgi:hypothetical protein